MFKKIYFEILSTMYFPKTLKEFLCIFTDDTIIVELIPFLLNKTNEQRNKDPVWLCYHLINDPLVKLNLF